MYRIPAVRDEDFMNSMARISNPERMRKRLINMNVNALIGYVIVEISAVIARALHLTTISYADVLLLSLIVDTATAVIILALYRIRNMSTFLEKAFFLSEVLLYFVMFSIVLFKIGEFRIVGLVYALVAITFELPFTTVAETITISAGSVIAQFVMTYYAIKVAGQPGSFVEELVYICCFLPTMVIIVYVARQINIQKDRIYASRRTVEEMNSTLLRANSQLEKASEIQRIEMELATRVQRSFLPSVPKGLYGWELALAFYPKYGVSGDFYDFYSRGDKLLGLSIFDVSGHGISSALLTMITKPIVYHEFNRMQGFSLCSIIKSVNERITAEFELLENFITGIILRFDDNSVEYVNAGHTDLFLKKAATRTVRAVEAEGTRFRGEPIGLNNFNIMCKVLRFSVAKGDHLVLFTDCLVESTDADGFMYGRQRLIDLLRGAPDGSAQDVLDHLMGGFRDFVKGGQINDDLTVIVARRTR